MSPLAGRTLLRLVGAALAVASLAGLVVLARITYGESLRESSLSIRFGMPLTPLSTLLGACGLAFGLWLVLRRPAPRRSNWT